MNINRRALVSRLAVLLSGLGASRFVRGSALTPATTEGPFYPTAPMRFTDVDNDLVKIEGRVKQSGGEVIRLTGTVKNTNGQPMPGVRVEIWQCDVNGRYLHTGDRQQVAYDQGFQGFGHDVTDADGRYSFRTIKPVSYPGRTPHIHVKVLSANEDLLTTQFYLKNHPGNNRDGIYRSMAADQADSVLMDVVQQSGVAVANVDMVV